MNCIRFPTYARVVTDEEMAALERKRESARAWMNMRAEERAERDRRIAEARDAAFRSMCRKLPDNVTPIGSSR